MKNKYVVLGIIIITATAAILGVYEIINSVIFNYKWKTLPSKHQNVTEIIQNTDDSTYKNEQLKYYFNE